MESTFHSTRVRSAFILCAMIAFFPAATARAQYSGAEAPPPDLSEGFDSITPEQCETWLNILAGPGFAGRGTGQPGHVKAAHWVAGKCAEFGLNPIGDAGTYFQMLPMSRMLVDPQKSKISGPKDWSMEFTEAVSLERFSSEPIVKGQLAIVSMSGAEVLLENGQELRNKIVILKTDEEADANAARTLARFRPAALLKIAAALPESTSQLKRPNSRRRRISSMNGHITQEAAEQLLQAADIQDDWLSLPKKDSAVVHTTEIDFTLEVRIREEPTAVPNVVAWFPGADPALTDEYLVVGAHLDHLGTRGDSVYPGADDNGSGSTAILSIARAISENPSKPRRSILFIWFAAEEMGLVGSAHYVANPAKPLDKMIGMLNIDMVGRNEEKGNEPASKNVNTLHLVGSKKGDEAFHEMILEMNNYVNLTFEFDEEKVFGRSDQINFFRKGVSVAFLFGGFHPDYHRPSDLPSKINYDKIAAAAKLFYLAAHKATEHGPYPVPAEDGDQPSNSPEKTAGDSK